MINIKDIHCNYNSCSTRAVYGYPGKDKTKCTKHRENGMIMRPSGRCKYINCRDVAIYGKNYTPLYCELHKIEDNINLTERECTSCKLIMILNKDNYCEFCDPLISTTVRLVKQNALMDYLDSRIDLPIPISTDKTINNGICGKERPDRVYDFKDKIIIIECDEHQHRERTCECEQTRMINIGQSFGGIPVYFIRWNPDNYAPAKLTTTLEPLKIRHKLVGDLLRDIHTNRITLPSALVSAIYLYYDNWENLSSEKWNILTEYDKIEHIE
jgi:hypothetical protein